MGINFGNIIQRKTLNTLKYHNFHLIQQKLLFCIKYSFFLRFLIQSYLEIGLYALVQLRSVINIQEHYSPEQYYVNRVPALISIVIYNQIAVLAIPPVLLLFTFKFSSNIKEKDEDFYKKWGSFFDEFKNNRGFLSTIFYTVYFS